MLKINLGKVLNTAQIALKKHSPEILTGIGIAGMITTTVLAVKATPKALMLIEEKKLDLDTEKLGPVETVKTVWPCYIPPVVTGVMSIGCLVGASSVNIRRNAALATAYALSETTLKDYQEKVIETIGEKKESEVKDLIAQDKLNKNPIVDDKIIITGKGDSLCYIELLGTPFRSSRDQIERARNAFNDYLLKNTHASLNDFYEALGLEDTKIGDDLGWDIQSNGMMELNFSSLVASNGEPCLVVIFNNPPVYDYDRYF